MLYKLTVIETNISSFSAEVIFNEIVECMFTIEDLRDILILDYQEKLNYKPLVNISHLAELSELLIQIFRTKVNYDKEKYLNVITDRVMPTKIFKLNFTPS
jgi:hypothetical protein